MASSSLLRLFYSCKIRTCIHVVLSLSWMSLFIYYLLGQLLNTSQHHPKKIEQDIYFDGRPNSLMAEIGFVGNPRYYPQSYNDDDLPIFIMPLHASDMQSIFGFLFNFRKHFRTKKLLIYDIGLKVDQKAMVEKHCKCLIRQVQWKRYPVHVADLKLNAYLPLLIQETLHEFGAVFLCSPRMRFNSASLSPEVTSQALLYGLAAWPVPDLPYPSSTFTHYNMFRFFNVSHRDYYFHRMAAPGAALYYNTPALHRRLMLPWVKCALDRDCLLPVGAQPHGCSFLHKPRYIYAGCHRYDLAPFNVLAGLMHGFEAPYVVSGDLLSLDTPARPALNHSAPGL